jgi:hypothetical protein
MKMGFHRAEVQRALGGVRALHPAGDLTTIPVQTILREALAFLA